MSKTILHIKDEVNIQFEGLSPECRRKLVESVEFYVPGAQYLPAVKLGRWNGKMSFCDIGARSYLNLLDVLLPIVYAYGYKVDIEDHRNPSEEFQFDIVETDSYSHLLWPTGHPLAGSPIMIKDHQVEIINLYLDNIQSVNIIPTGGGKTIVTGILSHKIQKYGKSIIIVPSKDLVTQTEADYINMGLDVGVFFGDRKEFGKTHTICTWQSLENISKGMYEVSIAEFIDDVVCVIADECFHGDSLVLTVEGYVPIKDITTGTKIINYSEKDNLFKQDTVVDVFKNLTKSASEKMYNLVFDTGTEIKVTGNHRFLTQRGWVRADQLDDLDDIKSIDT